MMCRGFTLIEMLLATILAAILLGGVLAVASSVSRDAARASVVQAPAMPGLVGLLRSDLTNAQSMQIDDTGRTLTLTGNNARDGQSLLANQRFARVVYTIDPHTRALARQQRYLDDEIHPEPWVELVAYDVTRIDVASTSAAVFTDDPDNQTIPRSLVVSIERPTGNINIAIHPR